MHLGRRRLEFLVVLLAPAVVQGVVVAYALDRAGGVDAFAFASVDGEEFARIARNVVAAGTFSQATEPPLAPDTWRTPGYPLFLAACIAVFDDTPAAWVLVQQVVAVLTAWLFYAVCRPALGATAAGVAMLLWVVDPFRAYYSLWLLSVTWFVPVVLVGLWAWQRQAGSPRPAAWGVVVGALTGYAVLVRPIAILLLPAVWVGAGLRAGGSRRRRAAIAGATLAGTLVVVGPWLVRNRVVAGHWGLSHQGGAVLAYFKATEVILWQRGAGSARYDRAAVEAVWDELDRQLPEELARRGVVLTDEARAGLRWPDLAWGRVYGADPFVVSAALRSIGVSALAERPGATVGCCLVRMLSVLTSPLDRLISPPTDSGAQVLGGGGAQRGLGGALGLAYLALVVLAGVRAVQWWRRGDRAFVLTCVVPVAALLLATTPQLDPRFRVPMMPFLLLLACRTRRASPAAKTGTRRSVDNGTRRGVDNRGAARR